MSQRFSPMSYILGNADTINSSTIEVHHPKNKTGAIYIKWKDPPKPNGLILSYDIEYVKANIANVSTFSKLFYFYQMKKF